MFYTGKGDNGTSNTFGNNTRCNKDEPIFWAMGNVDELGALLGVCFAKAKTNNREISLSIMIRNVQEDLFIVQAELAGADKKITTKQVNQLEKMIDDLANYVENPNSFVIAGSTELSAILDLARTVARRAERSLLKIESSVALLAYMNRLSSVLYVMARFAGTRITDKEQNPSY